MFKDQLAAVAVVVVSAFALAVLKADGPASTGPAGLPPVGKEPVKMDLLADWPSDGPLDLRPRVGRAALDQQAAEKKDFMRFKPMMTAC
jgi:hypothetical protein